MANAGSMNKQNQRQSQKSKRGKNHGIRRIRHTELPLICTACGEMKLVSSKQAYHPGGNTCGCAHTGKCSNNTACGIRDKKPCKCRNKMQFDTPALPRPTFTGKTTIQEG